MDDDTTIRGHGGHEDGLPAAFRLNGRRALVTGAGRGIGRAAAAALAAAGAEVTLAARSPSELSTAVGAIREAGGRADALPVDVTDIDGVDRALAARPAYDVLVNNAGMNRPAPFLEVTRSDFDRMVALNLRAAFFLAQAVCRRAVADRRTAVVINVSSQMGKVGGRDRSVYCATKWALEGMTRAMAIDLGPWGIRVNTLCPTFIETPMTATYFEDEGFRREVLGKIKLGRLGTVEDLTGAILFLASDASALMTGASLVVDGGWTAD